MTTRPGVRTPAVFGGRWRPLVNTRNAIVEQIGGDCNGEPRPLLKRLRWHLREVVPQVLGFYWVRLGFQPEQGAC